MNQNLRLQATRRIRGRRVAQARRNIIQNIQPRISRKSTYTVGFHISAFQASKSHLCKRAGSLNTYEGVPRRSHCEVGVNGWRGEKKTQPDRGSFATKPEHTISARLGGAFNTGLWRIPTEFCVLCEEVSTRKVCKSEVPLFVSTVKTGDNTPNLVNNIRREKELNKERQSA